MLHTLPIRTSSRLALALLSAGALCGAARAADDGKFIFQIYGFAMADFIYDTERVDPDWQDAFRPSKIPTVDGFFGNDGQSSISVKQSTFGVKGTVPVDNDVDPINFKFEFDLFGTGADAGQTTFRLRHAYGEWGPLLAGQTNSLFMDGDVWPNIIDYWGPNGMVFYRNVMIRYMAYRDENNTFAIAIERPGNDIDAGQIREFDPALGADIRANEELPDLTLQYRHVDEWGHVQVSGILRSIGFETIDPPDNEPSGSEFGWGINVGAHVNIDERDKLIGQVVYGEGIASYMNDGGTDLAPGGTSLLDIHAETVPLLGALIYYDHWWDEQWSTSIGYSIVNVDNRSLQEATAFHQGQYASVNLLYQPAKNIMIGGEIMWGEREDNDGATGDDFRFQFSVRYAFGTELKL